MHSPESTASYGPRWRLLVAVLVALSVGGPLAFGLPYFGRLSGSDSNFALQLVTGYMHALHAGVWFPRWLPEANSGLGSPVFYFYGRLPFLIAALIGTVLHVSDVAALLLCMGTFRAAAFFTCRAWLRRQATPRAADCGALAFVALPFAMMGNPVARVGFAETVATAFIPLVFLLLDDAGTSRCWAARKIAGLALVYAAMASSHLPQTLLVFVVAGVYVLIRRGGSGLLVNLAGTGLGLLMAGESVFPALLMQPLINAHAWRNNAYVELHNNFLFTRSRFQLYGFHSLDLYLYTSWFLCLGALVWAVMTRVTGSRRYDRQWLAQVITLSLCLLGITPVLRPVWLAVPPLQTLQFPWRLFPAGLAILAALLATLVEGKHARRTTCISILAVLVLGQEAIAAAGEFIGRAGPGDRQHVPSFVANTVPVYMAWLDRESAENRLKRSSAPEYLPAAATADGWHISGDETRVVFGSSLAVPMTVLPATLQEYKTPSGELGLHGSLPSPEYVVLPEFFFPDEKVEGSPDVSVKLDRSTGLAGLMLPAGPVSVRIAHVLKPRGVRLGYVTSALAVVLWMVLLMYCCRETLRPRKVVL